MFSQPRTEFFDFVEKLLHVMDFSKAKYYSEWLNPRRLSRALVAASRQITELANAFYNDPALQQHIVALLQQIGEVVHERLRFEQSYTEDEAPSRDESSWLGDSVPMEIVENANN